MLGNKRKKEKQLLNEMTKISLERNDAARSLFNFQKCSKCGSSSINIRVISPSGSSIEYQCDSCEEVMASTIKKGKNPQKALQIQDILTLTAQKLYNLIGEEVHNREIDISFRIN